MRKLKALTPLAITFTLASLTVLVVFIVVYVGEVRSALAMDPTSYNCTSDSMMKQQCENPYGATIPWSIFSALFYAWPAALISLVAGLMLFFRRKKTAIQKA